MSGSSGSLLGDVNKRVNTKSLSRGRRLLKPRARSFLLIKTGSVTCSRFQQREQRGPADIIDQMII